MSEPSLAWVSRAGWLLVVLGGALVAIGFGSLGSNPVGGNATLLLGVVVLVVGVAFVLDSGWLRDFVERRAHTLWRMTSGIAAAPSGENPETTQAMGRGALRFLVVYVVVFFVAGLMSMWTVWMAKPEAALVMLPDTVSNAPPADPTLPPIVDSVAPDTLTYGVGQPALFVFGSGFTEATEARVDGQVHRGGRTVNASLMIIELNESDFVESRTRYVTATVAGQPASRGVAFRVKSEAEVSVAWRPVPGLAFERPITVEARLVLLAILMGLVGGTLASLNSMASFRGEGRLTRSWFLYFFVSPFLAAGISFVLYTAVRAGLLTGTNVEFQAGSTPWGLLAISGLAGLFYDKTLLKLREIFMALFNPKDTRSGKLDEPVAGELTVQTQALRAATKGRMYRATLAATGGKPELSWAVKPKLPPGLKLDPLTGTIEGTPAEESALVSYTFTVTDMNRHSAHATIDFEVRS